MPLRTRLVLILVLLVALALAGIESLTYTTIKSSLVATIDSQMKSSISVWEHYFTHLEPGTPDPPASFESVQPDTYAALYTTDGRLVRFPAQSDGTDGNPAARCRDCQAQPILSTAYIGSVATARNPLPDRTVGGLDGADRFRILATVWVVSPRQTLVLVVAFPLTHVEATLTHLLALELVIGGCILAALAALSWFFVRLGLRPLERMATTATEIAGGDLSRRVIDVDERTEVGQLGAALNVMLEQIESAFQEKQASEDQLRRFIADASHELRTPLTSIRGYAELFKSGLADRPEDLAKALRRIESESSRMGGLVDDLLLLARLDQGRPLRDEAVDLAQLAADAVQDASVVDPSRQVTLIAAGPCYVLGDEQRLRQVLGNLVSNALAYSPPGAPIEVAVHSDEPAPAGLESAATTRPLGPTDLAAGLPAPTPTSVALTPVGPRAAVAVIDHGPGIPAENLPYVFQRFWRADPSRMRASGGNGLGLSIVAAVVAAHHGRVNIQATPGGGSTFVVELPAFPTAASLHEPQAIELADRTS